MDSTGELTHIPVPIAHTISDTYATVTIASRRATSVTAVCEKATRGGGVVPATVTPYPKTVFEAVVDMKDLEPSTRYNLFYSAKNDVSSTPMYKFTFSTRAKPV
jgi:hypothetical protein